MNNESNMATTGGTVDPYEAVSRRQSYIKKDSVKFFIHARDCVTVDELSAKQGAPKRILWRPPRDFQIQSQGTVHSDARGSFAKYFGSKVVIKNKCNGDIRYKATVPVGKLSDPVQIYARPYVVEGTIKPTGTKKDLSRTKGKGKQKREKSYSKAVDQATLDISERYLFTGDANLYTLYEEKVPGDDVASPNYYTMGKGVVDLAIILPNANQYSGEKYQEDLIVAEVIVVTRYLTTEQGQGVNAADVVKTPSYYIAVLNSMDALYHRDVDPIVTGAFGAVLSPGQPKLMSLPGDVSRKQVGLAGVNNEAHLYYYEKGNPAEKFRWNAYESGNTRLVIQGLVLAVGANKTQDNSTSIGSLEIGFDSGDETWKVVKPDGKGRTFANFGQGDARHGYVSARVPVVLYDVSPPTTARAGLITNYGDINAKAISWSAIVTALTTTIKVLTFASRIASMFV